MMSAKILTLLKLTFIVLFCTFVIIHKKNSPRIMIIHSYHADYSWVKEESEGIMRIFSKHPEINLRWHYMDLKQHQDEDFRRSTTSTTINAIQRWRPDILIIFDDIAQELVGMKYINHPHIKIIFSGVNDVPEKYHYDTADNVTGVLERKPLKTVDDTIDMLWKARGMTERQPRALLLGDSSFDFSAGLMEYEPRNFKWTHVQWLKPVIADTFEEWKQLVFRAPASADFILVSDYRQLHKEAGSKEFVTPTEVIQWTVANAKIPMLGLTTAVTQDGGMMGIATAGYEQGTLAAKMALDVTDGKPIKSIRVQAGNQSLISIRKTGLKDFGYETPSVYEAFARAIDLDFE
jgi:ABC-type uncharacterized transport system substrate-binding protein